MNRISAEVVSMIAARAALRVPGVSHLEDEMTDHLTKVLLGKDRFARGIRLSQFEEGIAVDVFLSVNFGARIPALAWNVQTAVRKAVEELADIKVKRVNIHIQGVTQVPGVQEAHGDRRETAPGADGDGGEAALETDGGLDLEGADDNPTLEAAGEGLLSAEPDSGLAAVETDGGLDLEGADDSSALEGAGEDLLSAEPDSGLAAEETDGDLPSEENPDASGADGDAGRPDMRTARGGAARDLRLRLDENGLVSWIPAGSEEEPPAAGRIRAAADPDGEMRKA